MNATHARNPFSSPPSGFRESTSVASITAAASQTSLSTSLANIRCPGRKQPHTVDLELAVVRLAPPESVSKIVEANNHNRSVRKLCERALGRLTDALAKLVSPFFADEISRENVRITRGVRDGLGLLVGCGSPAAKGVVTMSPYYPGYHETFTKLGISNLDIPLITDKDLHRFDLPKLERALASPAGQSVRRHAQQTAGAVIVTAPNTPTNLYPAKHDLVALQKICEKNKGSLIIDATFHSTVHNTEESTGKNTPWTPPRLPLPRTIAMGSMHEPFSLSQLGIQVGFLVASKDVISALRSESRKAGTSTQLPDPRAIACAYAAMFEAQDYLETRQRTLDVRHRYAEIKFKDLPHVIDISGPAGTTKWLTFASAERAAEALQQLKQDGIKVKPGSHYGAPSSMRISLVSIRDDEEFMEAMDRVAASLENLK